MDLYYSRSVPSSSKNYYKNLLKMQKKTREDTVPAHSDRKCTILLTEERKTIMKLLGILFFLIRIG